MIFRDLALLGVLFRNERRWGTQVSFRIRARRCARRRRHRREVQGGWFVLAAARAQHSATLEARTSRRGTEECEIATFSRLHTLSDNFPHVQ